MVQFLSRQTSSQAVMVTYRDSFHSVASGGDDVPGEGRFFREATFKIKAEDANLNFLSDTGMYCRIVHSSNGSVL